MDGVLSAHFNDRWRITLAREFFLLYPLIFFIKLKEKAIMSVNRNIKTSYNKHYLLEIIKTKTAFIFYFRNPSLVLPVQYYCHFFFLIASLRVMKRKDDKFNLSLRPWMSSQYRPKKFSHLNLSLILLIKLV